MPESYKVEFPRVVSFAGGGGGGGGGPITSADITDATVTGKALLTALNAAAARLTLLLGTAATLDVPSSGDATSGQVVKGSDTRLTNSRTPTAHTHAPSEISGSTAIGQSVLTAANAAAILSLLGISSSITLDAVFLRNPQTGTLVKLEWKGSTDDAAELVLTPQ